MFAARTALLRAPKTLPIDPIRKWKVLRGDTVQVMAGKDRGRAGKVLKVDRKHNRVIVEGCGLVTKHIKATQQHPGARITKESGIHVSKVAVLDEAGKPAKVAFRFLDDGTKVRVNRQTGEVLPRPIELADRKFPVSPEAGPRDTVMPLSSSSTPSSS